MTERIMAALDAGLTIALSEAEKHSAAVGYSHSYTVVRTETDYVIRDWEVSDDAAALPCERDWTVAAEGLRAWLTALPAESRRDACIETTPGCFALLRDDPRFRPRTKRD